MKRGKVKGLLRLRHEGLFSYTRSGYRFDKRVIYGLILFILVLGFLTILKHGVVYNEFYYSCPEDSLRGCKNPCYLSGAGYCEEFPYNNMVEYIPAGFSWGTPPPDSWLLNTAPLVVLLLIIGAFLFNHLYYNEGGKNGKSEN